MGMTILQVAPTLTLYGLGLCDDHTHHAQRHGHKMLYVGLGWLTEKWMIIMQFDNFSQKLEHSAVLNVIELQLPRPDRVKKSWYG